MSEQRATPRLSLTEFQIVRDEDSKKVVGYLGDINTGGLMVLSRKPHDTGERRRLRIQYRRRDGEFETPVFEAESVWARPPTSGPYHETGFRLVDPSPEVTRSLEGVLADLEARDEA